MSRTITPQVAPRLPKRRADIRLLLCSVTICSVFIILFLPSVVMNLLRGCPDPRLHMAASNLTWLNSCVNPIVYAMMNTRFRKGKVQDIKLANSFLSHIFGFSSHLFQPIIAAHIKIKKPYKLLF